VSRGTPVARHIVVDPGIEFKAVEGDALAADGDFREGGADLGVEAVAIHAEVAGRVPEAEQPGQAGQGFGPVVR
jgi:hypothetical protein